jgi:hypothetical protein
MTENVREREVFVGLFDILGFRELVRNKELSKVADTYRKAKSDIQDSINYVNDLHRYYRRKDRVKFRAFSDTFLIYTSGTSENCFLSILGACGSLFSAAVEHSLPLRGSVTRGPLMSSSGVELGKAIVEAYENEQKQDWIGCWIAEPCILKTDITKYIASKRIVPYEIPLKDGEVHSRLAFNWVQSVSWKVMLENGRNDFTSDQIIEAITFTDGTPNDWATRRKLENTKRFVEFVLSPEFIESYKSRKV